MDCQQLVLRLCSYLDGETSPELQLHLQQCRPCRLLVAHCQQTIRIYKQPAPPLPAGMHQRLMQQLGKRVPPGGRRPHPTT